MIMQSKTIYHEFSRHLPESDRAEIIRCGWGSTTPVKPIKGRTGTRVQVIEVTEDEYAVWLAAQERTKATLWDAWRRN